MRIPQPVDHVAMPAQAATTTISTSTRAQDRRRHRRHELSHPTNLSGIQCDFGDNITGGVVDLSAGGVRIRTADDTIRPGTNVEVRLSLPQHAGISPFVRLAGAQPEPSCEWSGTFEVARRVERTDGTFDLGGTLLNMTPVDRGMLGLYLSIHPLAA